MPTRTYGCLNTHCRATFDSSVDPVWSDTGRLAAGPPCEVCGERTKWIPGPTQVMRATEGAVPKSKFIHQTLDRVVGNFNARQELAGLKISDIRPVAGEPTIKAAANGSAAPLQRHVFRDAAGRPWDVTMPVQTGNAWPVAVPGQSEKVKQKQLSREWIPERERKAAGAARAPVVEAACDRSGRVVKAP